MFTCSYPHAHSLPREYQDTMPMPPSMLLLSTDKVLKIGNMATYKRQGIQMQITSNDIC
jgi:hypothetical protein